MQLKNNIEIIGYKGKWHVVDTKNWRGERIYMLEHSTHGKNTAMLIVDGDKKIIEESVYKGWSDLSG